MDSVTNESRCIANMNRAFFLFLSLSLLLLATGALNAKDKHVRKNQPASDEDQIEVAAHLPLRAGPVSRLVETRHYRREYLYAEHENKTVTLIDVTSATAPAAIAEIVMPSGLHNSLVSVSGTAALVGSGEERGDDPRAPQTFRIMDLKDPAHPKVTQEF